MAIGKNVVKRLGLRRKPPARFQSGGLSGLLAGVFRPGDPDGSKAAAASVRSRQTEPLTAVQRLNNYAHQDGTQFPRDTPSRRRRLNKKLRAAGVEGAHADFALLDEVTG